MQNIMKKIIASALCLAVLNYSPLAQAAETSAQGLSIGAEIGTTGIGGTANWRLSDHFGVRAGAHFFQYDIDEFTYTAKPNGISNEDVDFDVEFRLLSGPLAVDIYPWADSAFHISVGALINLNRFTADVKNSGVVNSTFVFNGNDYLQSAVGDFDLEVEQQVFSPFISIGTSVYFGEKKRWAVTGELGVAYTGSPDVSLNAPNRDPSLDLTPNFADDIAGEERKIEKDAEDFQFYPIIKLGVSFRF